MVKVAKLKPTMSEALATLVAVAIAKKPLGKTFPGSRWVKPLLGPGKPVYKNQNPQLNIDFSVDRLEFPEQQVFDPRLLKIEPGKNNELHRHAHESLFVILSGHGEVRVGDDWCPVQLGDIAFVPRWAFHQTRNLSQDAPLVVLAITDFGFTRAVLGDYDKRTRLAKAGIDAKPF